MSDDESKPAGAPASELFEDCVMDGGTVWTTCGLCGRTHFDAGLPGCFADADLEDLLKAADEKPDEYVVHNGTSIGFGYIDGQQVVWGCPCGKLGRYERFIWNNRRLIIEYLVKRLSQDKADAEEQLSAFSVFRQAEAKADPPGERGA